MKIFPMDQEILQIIKKDRNDLTKELNLLSENVMKSVINASKLIAETFENNGKLLIAGNGGSAADSQHLAAEFIIRLNKTDIRIGLPAIALTTDSSLITAGANDIGFDHIFERQIEALGNGNDLFLGISTSGNSENIINGIKKAHSMKLKTILLTGRNNPDINTDITINAPGNGVSQIQILHSFIEHLIVKIVLIYIKNGKKVDFFYKNC